MDDEPGDQPVSTPDPARPATVPAPSGPMAEWPARAADTVDSLVATVHDRFIRPVVLGARAIVFGLLILTLSVVLAVLISVSLVRLLTVYVFDGRVWASYLLLGSIFTGGGLYLWSQRSSALDVTGGSAG